MKYNFEKLNARIIQKYKSQAECARALGTTKSNLNGKINGKFKFTFDDIPKLQHILNIPKKEVWYYFFDTKVK